MNDTIAYNTARHIITCARIMRASKDFDEGLNQVLLTIKDLVPCDRVYILLTNCWPAKVTHEWTAPGKLSASDIFTHLGQNNVSSVSVKVEKYAVQVTQAEDFREKHPDIYEDMLRHGMRNTLTAPLYENGVMFGNVGLDNFEMSKSVNTLEFMQALAFFLASEIQTHKLMQQLSELSNADLLTGVQNRNAMNQKIDQIQGGSLGVLYADINGLKSVNDNQGHEAGDRLIKRGSGILMQIFDRMDVYRAGGDEFVVLMKDVSEENFMERVKRLTDILEKTKEVSMAYGYRYTESCMDPETLIRETDEAMYQNKNAYYQKNKRLR